MDMRLRGEIAETLRRAADGTIPEDEFWKRFKHWADLLQDARIMIAWEQAEHYWGNFHQKNIFFVRVKPDPGQLEIGKEALFLLARAFEEDWGEAKMERELHKT